MNTHAFHANNTIINKVFAFNTVKILFSIAIVLILRLFSIFYYCYCKSIINKTLSFQLHQRNPLTCCALPLCHLLLFLLSIFQCNQLLSVRQWERERCVVSQYFCVQKHSNYASTLTCAPVTVTAVTPLLPPLLHSKACGGVRSCNWGQLLQCNKRGEMEIREKC